MKIISLNVNNFGGTKMKPLPGKDFVKAVKSWRSEIQETIDENVERIIQIIKNYEIVILQEVDTNCNAFDKLKNECEKNLFEIVYPNGFNENTFSNGYNSITCMLIKQYIIYERRECNFSKKVQKEYKNVDVIVGDLRIL